VWRTWQDQAVAPKKGKAEEGIDQLYGSPLGEFTKERNALAKRLRGDGDSDAAERVKSLRKPSLPAWAINQGVRADAGAAKRLLGAGERLRKASDGDSLREAMREEAEAVEQMTAAAESAAEGETLSSAMVDRVRDTLRAVAGDDELRGEFEGGRVERDRKAVGLGGAFAASPGGGRASKRSGPSAAEGRKLESAVKRARKALDARRSDLADAQARAEKARKALGDATRKLERAQEDVDAAQSELDAAEAARDEA
jgi:hypothetical protein